MELPINFQYIPDKDCSEYVEDLLSVVDGLRYVAIVTDKNASKCYPFELNNNLAGRREWNQYHVIADLGATYADPTQSSHILNSIEEIFGNIVTEGEILHLISSVHTPMPGETPTNFWLRSGRHKLITLAIKDIVSAGISVAPQGESAQLFKSGVSVTDALAIRRLYQIAKKPILAQCDLTQEITKLMQLNSWTVKQCMNYLTDKYKTLSCESVDELLDQEENAEYANDLIKGIHIVKEGCCTYVQLPVEDYELIHMQSHRNNFTMQNISIKDKDNSFMVANACTDIYDTGWTLFFKLNKYISGWVSEQESGDIKGIKETTAVILAGNYPYVVPITPIYKLESDKTSLFN